MSATHVVEKIVSYFDADSMRNSKSVSIMWNNALGELNEEKFWQDLLKQKVIQFFFQFIRYPSIRNSEIILGVI